MFVPARGGIGEAVSVQANSISAVMVNKTGGNYRALYVPEQLSRETYNSLLQEPSIQEVLTLISHANCVVHSIGRALHMAARRKMSDDEMVMLKQKMPWQNRLVISLMKKEKWSIKFHELPSIKTYKKFLCRRNCGRQNESQSHSRIYEKCTKTNVAHHR